MERVKDFLLALALGLFAFALLRFPTEAADAARQGLSLCLQSVLPSLFPFFVLSSLVVSGGGADVLAQLLEPLMRPLFGLGGTGALALALGLVGGYPVGARTVAELYRGGALGRDEAERLLGFCNNSGPGFILGVCGGAVFHSARAGLWLCLIHALAALLTGAVLSLFARGETKTRNAAASKAPRSLRPRRRFGAAHRCGFVIPAPVGRANHAAASKAPRSPRPQRRFGAAHRCGLVIPAPAGRANHAAASKAPRSSRPRRRFGAFPSAVRDSFAAVWSVCGFVVLFAVLLRFAALALPVSAPLLGTVELTGGVLALPSDRHGFVLCAALLGWGSLSVHAQTLSVLDGTGLSTRWYFPGKALQSLLSIPPALFVSAHLLCFP